MIIEPLELSVSDTIFWSITLESSIAILFVSIMNIQSLITLLENIYSTGVTHDNWNMLKIVYSKDHRRQHGSRYVWQLLFHKITKWPITQQPLEVEKNYCMRGVLIILGLFWYLFEPILKTNQILFNKISHCFLMTTKSFSGYTTELRHSA